MALSGGVFQNRLLLELVDDGLTEMGFKVLKHSLIPPNDGGIALGQAVYGMAYVPAAQINIDNIMQIRIINVL